MSTGTDRIVVDDAHLWYGKGETGTYALRGVSLEVTAGEVVMIQGPSGSGKTTLLQLIGGLKTPDRGRVTICGDTTEGLSAVDLRKLRLQRVGFVFQFFNLLPSLNAWENVALPLDVTGVPRAEAEIRARALLAEVGLADRSTFMPNELSGGQRQRVAVARALSNEPDVILADEPTAALDGVNGAQVIDAMRRLALEKSRIVVIVSHDQRVQGMVDRVITVEDGLIVQNGPSSPDPSSRVSEVIAQ